MILFFIGFASAFLLNILLGLIAWAFTMIKRRAMFGRFDATDFKMAAFCALLGYAALLIVAIDEE